MKRKLMHLQLWITVEWIVTFSYNWKPYTYDQLTNLWFEEIQFEGDLTPTKREYPEEPIVHKSYNTTVKYHEWWVWNCRIIGVGDKYIPDYENKKWVIVYDYKSWSWDWDWVAYHIDDWKLVSRSLSHCSCYWPWDWDERNKCSIDNVKESCKEIVLQFIN